LSGKRRRGKLRGLGIGTLGKLQGDMERGREKIEDCVISRVNARGGKIIEN
jgi:hypothetical protein